MIQRIMQSEKIGKTKKKYGKIANSLNRFTLKLVLYLFLGVMTIPIYIVVVSSLRETTLVIDSYGIPNPITFENFIFAWTEANMQQYMINSIIVVSVSIFLIVVCSTLAAFSLVYFDFKRRKLILVLILAGFMIPAQIIFIPRYVMMSWLNLLDGRYSLILVYVASALAFSIFLIRQYFLNVPDSLSEAARLDGCSDFQIFYKIYLPIGKPALAAVVVYQFIRLWNEFLYAIAFVDTDSKRTLPAGLLQLQGTYGTNWGHVLAGVAIAVFPVVLFLILFRKQFIRGVNMRM